MDFSRRSLLLVVVLGGCAPDAPPAAAPPPLPDADLTEPGVVSALEESRAAAVSSPRDAEAAALYAARLDANGFDGSAAAAWERVVALAPGDPRPRLHLARALRALGRDEAALESLRAAEARAPDVAALRVRRGAWLLDAGRVDAAAAAFEEAARIAPLDEGPRIGAARVALERAEFDEARTRLDALADAGTREPYVFFLLSQAARRQGDDVTAELAAARARPDRRSDWLVCAWEREVLAERCGFDHRKAMLLARIRRDPPDRLLDELELLHAERPDDLGLLAARVEALVAARDPAGAGRLLDAAAAARPDHPRIELLRARLLELQGDPRGALAAAERAASKQPGLGVAQFQVGVLRSGFGDTAGAVEALEEAARLGFEDDHLLVNLALLQHRLGRRDDALRSLEAAVARDPAGLPAWLMLTDLRLSGGDVAGARAAHARAAALAPDDRRVSTLEARLREAGG